MSTTATVHLYVTDTMADWEAGHAIAHIVKPSWQRHPGRYSVRTVGATGDTVRTMGGVTIVPDMTVAELDPADSALLILTGAETWDDADRHAGIVAAAADFLAHGTPVAAICGATWGLATAGLLDNRAHTSNAAVYLQTSGYAGASRFKDEPAVTDGPLITASGCFPVDFARHIFAALDLYAPDVLGAWYGLYTTGSPEHYAVLAAA
jgi:putative intracellular protease/amidase